MATGYNPLALLHTARCSSEGDGQGIIYERPEYWLSGTSALLVAPTQVPQHLVHDHLLLVCLAVVIRTVLTTHTTPSDKSATLHTVVLGE